MIRLVWPWLLLLLPLPLLLRRWLPPVASDAIRALRLPHLDRFEPLTEALRRRSTRHWPILALVWGLLILAAARPQWLGEPIPLPVAGRDLMLAVDISGSMDKPLVSAGGAELSRLDLVKQVAGAFIAGRPEDRIGLILFGSRAYLQTPLTYDGTTVAAMLDEAVVGLAGIDTAIGDAIALAARQLSEQPGGNRVLILLTDGDNTVGTIDPIPAAELAARAGIRVHAIGLSSPAGLPVDIDPRRSSDDLDPALLQAITRIAGGQWFIASDQTALARVYAVLDQLEPSVRGTRTYRPARPLYPWPAALALLLSVLLAAHWLGRQRVGVPPGQADAR